MWKYIIDGFSGPGAALMYAITATGALALAIALERTFWLFVRWRSDAVGVIAALDRGDRDAARKAAGDTPMGDVVSAGLAETDPEVAWEAMGAAAVEAEETIRARVGYLATIANLATMLGLLGTVYGLMLAFGSLGDTSGGARAVKLSEGISTAMSATALGLVVGIFALATHAVIDGRARAMLAAVEVVAGRVAVKTRKG